MEQKSCDNSDKTKLQELVESGFLETGKKFKMLGGAHKGKEFPVYAQAGDVAGLVYNPEEDSVEMVFKLSIPFKGNS